MERKTDNNMPNIVLLSIDCLRQDHLGCYGYKRATTPNIDKIAEKGVLFNQAVSCATFTVASLLSILTSYTFKHNMLDLKNNILGMSNDPLSGFITMPGLLKNRGYRTAFLGPWIANSIKGLVRDFDFSSGCPLYLSKESVMVVREMLYRHNAGSQAAGKVALEISKKLALKSAAVSNERGDFLTQKAMRWIDKNKDGRFFLWLHYFDMHPPFCLSKKFRGMFLSDEPRGKNTKTSFPAGECGIIPEFASENNISDVDYYISQYDGALRFIDEQIGRLGEYLDKSGLGRNTLLVITADHGEYLGEKDICFRHACFPYDVVMKVPLIVKCDNLFEQRVIDSQVQTIDIAPTLLDILGTEKNQVMQGESFLFLLRGLGPRHAPYAFIGGEGISAVRGEDHKLIHVEPDKINNGSKRWVYSTGSFRIDQQPEYLFFDLKKDPQESVNLAGTESERLRFLKEKLNKWMKTPAYKFRSASSSDEYSLEKLKSLGYM